MEENRSENSGPDNSRREDQGRVEGDPTRLDIHAEDIKKVPSTLWQFLKSTLSIRDDVDIQGTISTIQNEIEFKGHSVWILVFSILVASVGLDANSVAVVIGAMLISPLMGPIKGVGLAVGTNDFKLLMKSLVNFGVMVGISILVSYLFFKVSPFKEPSSEIMARTSTDFRNALIALFGGFAGIIAATQHAKTYTVISGVAIATALMPPLCAAGFFLANADWTNFFNAGYLFLINSLLICVAALIVVRYLKFPVVEFVNPKTERKVKIYIVVFMLLILIPSGLSFYTVMQENLFIRDARIFVDKKIRDYPGISITTEDYLYHDENYKGKNTIKIAVIGSTIDDEIIDEWRRQMKDYELSDSKLVIIQNERENAENMLSFEEHRALEKDLRSQIRTRDSELAVMEKTLARYKTQLKAFADLNPPRVRKLEKEAKINFPELKAISLSIGLRSEKERIDSLFVARVEWIEAIPDSLHSSKSNQLEEWLKADLERKDIEVIQINDGEKQEE